MLGDTAVAVHPDDERYRHLDRQAGARCRSRIAASRSSPTSYVDPEFGTGCVKITPAHDFNDYEVGLRHDLPLISVLDVNAQINENAPRALSRPRPLRGAQARRRGPRGRRPARRESRTTRR